MNHVQQMAALYLGAIIAILAVGGMMASDGINRFVVGSLIGMILFGLVGMIVLTVITIIYMLISGTCPPWASLMTNFCPVG